MASLYSSLVDVWDLFFLLGNSLYTPSNNWQPPLNQSDRICNRGNESCSTWTSRLSSLLDFISCPLWFHLSLRNAWDQKTCKKARLRIGLTMEAKQKQKKALLTLKQGVLP